MWQRESESEIQDKVSPEWCAGHHSNLSKPPRISISNQLVHVVTLSCEGDHSCRQNVFSNMAAYTLKKITWRASKNAGP